MPYGNIIIAPTMKGLKMRTFEEDIELVVNIAKQCFGDVVTDKAIVNDIVSKALSGEIQVTVQAIRNLYPFLSKRNCFKVHQEALKILMNSTPREK